MTLRIFIADDHAVVRLGLRKLLTEVGGFEVVGEADNGRAVLNAPALQDADVLVLDLSLPIVSGSEVLRRVRSLRPSLIIVVHSMHPADQFRRRALMDGASEYVGKDRPPSELIDAIWACVARGPDAPATTTAEPTPDSPHLLLTRREHQVFHLLVSGRTVAEIAAEIDVHSCTVSNHLARIRTKLGLQTTAEMVRYALAEGLIAADPYSVPTDG